MKENEKFEDLFKEKFENYEVEVRSTVWSNIQTGLKGAGIGILIKTLINKLGSNTIVAIVSSAATVVSTVLIMQWTNNSDKTAVVTKDKVIPSTIKEEPNIENTVEKEIPLVNSEKSNTPANQIKENTNTKNNTIATKNELNNVIKDISKKQVAFISSSTVAGPVPLIVNFENIGNGKINRWDFGDGKKDKNNSNPVHAYDVPGFYTVLLTSTNADGVTAVDTLKIEVYGNSSLSNTPISFSPNGDGADDYFSTDPKNIKELSAKIIDPNTNRIVYQWKGINGRWDGKDKKGNDVSEGIYYYVFSAIGLDGKKIELNGKVKLVR